MILMDRGHILRTRYMFLRSHSFSLFVFSFINRRAGGNTTKKTCAAQYRNMDGKGGETTTKETEETQTVAEEAMHKKKRAQRGE